jgi:hypothetical protein
MNYDAGATAIISQSSQSVDIRDAAPAGIAATPDHGNGSVSVQGFNGGSAVFWSVKPAILRAVKLGDDADTTEAICGQLAGAFWGESNIPESLQSGLAHRDMIEEALAGILGA